MLIVMLILAAFSKMCQNTMQAVNNASLFLYVCKCRSEHRKRALLCKLYTFFIKMFENIKTWIP